MNDLRLMIMQHGDEGFWPIAGPLMADEELARRRGGYPMFSKPSYTWIFAYRGDKLAGFCAVAPGQPSRILYAFAWGNAEAYELVVRAADSMASPLMSVVLNENLRTMERLGFKKLADRGKRFAVVGKGNLPEDALNG